mgnify:CR=1 FL=1
MKLVLATMCISEHILDIASIVSNKFNYILPGFVQKGGFIKCLILLMDP